MKGSILQWLVSGLVVNDRQSTATLNQSINQINQTFNMQTFIREDDSDAQKKQISRRMQPQEVQWLT